MPRRYRFAVLGGSFDHLHAGHRALLARALDLADRVAVGVTSDAYLRVHPKPGAARIEPFAARRRAVARFLAARAPRRRWRIAVLDDGWGGSVAPGPDVLVASSETIGGARSVNRERRRRGLAPLAVELVPLVRGADGQPIRSRRIRAGEIDADGRRRATLRVAAVGASAADVAAWRPFLQSLAPRLRLTRRSGRVAPGALRAAARRAARGQDLGIARSVGSASSPARVAVATPDGTVVDRSVASGGLPAALGRLRARGEAAAPRRARRG